ncbi:MAG TPA: competence protein [Treponema sp.]|nr:competence protein [Treponema sp.]
MAEIAPAPFRQEAAEETARLLIQRLTECSRDLVLAESCTAGLVAEILARVPGASRALWGSFVCYTAEAKIAMLGLDPVRLNRFGLVSGETALDMACGALKKSGASIAAAITGLAGPEGDGSAVPVGTVWIAAAERGAQSEAHVHNFTGSRNEIRFQAAFTALRELLRILDKN